jgi:hypothetical protein
MACFQSKFWKRAVFLDVLPGFYHVFLHLDAGLLFYVVLATGASVASLWLESKSVLHEYGCLLILATRFEFLLGRQSGGV